MELPGSIIVHKVNVEVEEDVDKMNQKYLPQLLAMVPTLQVPIALGDTIEFAGDSLEESPFQFYHGRILQILVDPNGLPGGEDIPFHPQAHHVDGIPIALIHIALTIIQSENLFLHSIWQAHSEEVLAATNGIAELSRDLQLC